MFFMFLIYLYKFCTKLNYKVKVFMHIYVHFFNICHAQKDKKTGNGKHIKIHKN